MHLGLLGTRFPPHSSRLFHCSRCPTRQRGPYLWTTRTPVPGAEATPHAQPCRRQDGAQTEQETKKRWCLIGPRRWAPGRPGPAGSRGFGVPSALAQHRREGVRTRGAESEPWVPRCRFHPTRRGTGCRVACCWPQPPAWTWQLLFRKLWLDSWTCSEG